MTSNEDVTSFIRSTFHSVWSLELLVHLKRGGERSWMQPELVSALRGSDLIVAQGVDGLTAAGLVLIEQDGSVRYNPASNDLRDLADRTEALYVRSPDAVRRIIIAPVSGGLTAFADAFRLRKD